MLRDDAVNAVSSSNVDLPVEIPHRSDAGKERDLLLQLLVRDAAGEHLLYYIKDTFNNLLFTDFIILLSIFIPNWGSNLV